jgi:hypothetical protein
MSPSPTETYLLTHHHITSTLSKLYLLVDLRQWPRLALSEVFAPTFTLDYTSMFGGEPRDVAPAEVIEGWKRIMHGKRSMHVLTGTVVEGLRAPGAAGEDKVQPDRVKVYVYVTANLVKEAVEGSEEEEKWASNGGIGEVDLVRLPEEECRRLYGEAWDGNPWRVKAYKPDIKWYRGETEAVLGIKGRDTD